jgi:hypothetical protein
LALDTAIAFWDNLNVFKTEVIGMSQPSEYSAQRDWFCGAVGLLAVSAVACAAAGSTFGFVVAVALIAVLCTRAQWARIVTLVVTAYAGLVALLIALFARGPNSFSAFIAALICGAIFWLLVRPGMDRYFGAGQRPLSHLIPAPPRPGSLPHLQPAPPPPPVSLQVGTHPATGTTQQQWARLQQQLEATRREEERASARESQQQVGAAGPGFPWLIAALAAFMCSYAWSIGDGFSKFILLLVLPGFVATLARWIPARGFFLGVLLVAGGIIVAAQWTFVSPRIQPVLQHHGGAIFAAVVLLAYVVAMCYSGLPGACESAD